MVKSADRVCKILDLLGNNKGGLKHAEIARLLKIPISSLSGLLSCLVSNQFLAIDSAGMKYLLGPQILTLAGSFLSGFDLAEFSKPVVKEIAKKTGESVGVAIRMGNEMMIICKEDSPRLIKRTIQIGERHALYATAAGKAILAHLPKTEIEHYLSSVELSPLTKKTITNLQKMKKELARIRSTGLAHNYEESSEEIVAIAAPLFDINGNVLASLAVSLPVARFTHEKESLITSALRDASLSLSRKLGFKG
jgi:DNA-binding IclR family transcriptional regulator